MRLCTKRQFMRTVYGVAHRVQQVADMLVNTIHGAVVRPLDVIYKVRVAIARPHSIKTAFEAAKVFCNKVVIQTSLWQP